MDFNARAAEWDNGARKSRAKVIADAVWDAVRDVAPRSALDFGCGTGLVAMLLVDRFDRMVLVDSSEGMIAQVSAKLAQANVRNVAAVHADLTAGNRIPGAPFDAIYASMSLHHIRDVDGALAALAALLREGGALCAIELTEVDADFHASEPDFDGHNGFDRREFRARMARAGLRVMSDRIIFRGIKAGGETLSRYALFEMTGIK
ncbi:MAG: class I SAM-dependent methyltransferase [Clostridiales bacterium]|nr:class I SAM-dependent methyltransferase [Clostridiales bacterium]